MRNLYAKKCCWCKVVVQPGDGKLWSYNDKWYVGCQSCIDDKFKDDDKGDQFPYFFWTFIFSYGITITTMVVTKIF